MRGPVMDARTKLWQKKFNKKLQKKLKVATVNGFIQIQRIQ